MKKITLVFMCLLGLQFGHAQDTCETAIAVTSGTTSTVGTINGTYNNLCGWSVTGDNAEWYAYTATISGVLTITSDLSQNDGVVNSDDTRLSVFTGNCAALECYASADDVSGSNYLTTLDILVESGMTYYIHWDNRWSSSGFDFTITETEVPCPSEPLETPYTNNFSNGNEVLVCWDLIDADDDGFGWYIVDYDLDEDEVPDGNPTLASNSYDNASGQALTPDNWIITQAIDLTYAEAGTPLLTWKARGLDADFPDENYSVYVSTGSDIADFLASSVSFTEIIGQNGGAGVFVDRTLDISSFAGEIIYVAFRHYAVTDQFVLNIDDLSVTATLGLENVASNQFTHIYNKDTKNLTLTSSALAFDHIELYNILGQNVLQKGLSQSNEIVNLSNLQDGVYVAKVTIEGRTKTFKLLKQ